MRFAIGALLSVVVLGAPSLASEAQIADAAGGTDRLIVVARSDADYDNLRAQVQQAGGSIVKDMRDGGMLVVTGAASLKAKIQATGLTRGVAKDHVETLVPPSSMLDLTNSTGVRSKTTLDATTSQTAAAAMGRRSVTGDPAFSYPGLMWDFDRIEAPAAWQATLGSPSIKVGVADTGVDFTHSDLAPNVANVVDFTAEENPPICKTFFANPFDPKQPGIGDQDLAAMFGGPETTDWNGHGSWIGGNIAAALDGQGINGIAPKVKLVSLKISQWCGSAYDSTILDAFLYAGKHHIDVVSISFGGYLNLSDADQAIIWGQYNSVVQKLRGQGTLIVAAAGNEHVQVGPAGRVTSHGQLTTPRAAVNDLFGHFEVPGGVPGVIDVSSTGNVVVPSSSDCAPGTTGTASNTNAVCKPTSDAHQAAGQGKENQLAYYSDYGSRIDVAGPGGARKFNLPVWDRGGTPGFPYTTTDLTTAFEDFSTTSNWALEIPCITFTGGGFPANQCYAAIQGTSMATPHASAVAALILSSDASTRDNVDRLQRVLQNSARHITGNQTQVLSATDKSMADLTGAPCTTGYCHLGGEAIPDRQAYGAGLVDARRAVNR